MDDGLLLAVNNLKVSFQTEDGSINAVEDVTFDIRPGETVVVVGESGSGKSVTSLAIMGLIANPPGRISGGTIDFRSNTGAQLELTGLKTSAMRRIRGNDIAMIFQEPMTSLNPVYTIGDQITEAIRLHQHKGRRQAAELAVEMLELLGIPEPRKRMGNYPHQMSGGMRQRVMIAMALSCRPALLIADEPTTALDVTIQAQILELMKRLQKELGMAVIFITHNLGVAAEIADRVVVMYAGRVVEQGTAAAIFKSPRMPYTKGLLESVPKFDDTRNKGDLLHAIPGNVPLPSRLPPGCAFHPRCQYAQAGRCDTDMPALEECGDQHQVRCLRWQEIDTEVPA